MRHFSKIHFILSIENVIGFKFPSQLSIALGTPLIMSSLAIFNAGKTDENTTKIYFHYLIDHNSFIIDHSMK